MDPNDFFIDNLCRQMFGLYGAGGGGFKLELRRERRCSSSSEQSPMRRRSISTDYSDEEYEDSPHQRFLNSNWTKNYFERGELARKNAEALIREEEQAKIRAEKKKAKKEKQKLKKLQAKEKDLESNDLDNSNKDSVSEPKEGEELDVNAAFVSKAIKKVKNPKIITQQPKAKTQVKDFDKLIKQAEEFEKVQHYKEAVYYLSEAINLKPQNIELILKRSFLHYQLAQFEKSVRDAKKVIKISPSNPHATYRLGEGYFALSNFTEAEEAYIKLISQPLYCEKASNRLLSIRIQQLVSMGYNPNEAFTAVTRSKNKTLDEAIEFLNELEEGKHREDLYYSDEESEEEDSECGRDEEEYETEEEEIVDEGFSSRSSASSESASCQPIKIDKNSSVLTDHTNPFGCCSLFVGNLNKGVTHKDLQEAFMKFGAFQSVKLVNEPTCFAFINYIKPSAAGMAMKVLQGSKSRLSSKPLLIKYPTKVIEALLPASNKRAIVKATTLNDPKKPLTSVEQRLVTGNPRPSLKTEECTYWRTIGCTYGENCFNLHIPENRGADLTLPKKKTCAKN